MMNLALPPLGLTTSLISQPHVQILNRNFNLLQYNIIAKRLNDDLPTFSAAHRDTQSSYRSADNIREKFPVPNEPPYTAFLGNLDFDTSEHDLETFFRDLTVASIRLIRQDDKPKGFGYIEFGDKNSLIEALKLDGESVRNRQIKIDVAEQKQDRRGGRGGDRGDRGGRDNFSRRDGDDEREERRRREDDPKFETDWRSGASGPLANKEREGGFGGGRGGDRRDNGGGDRDRSGGSGTWDRSGGRDFDGDRPPRRDDGYGDRPPRREFGADRPARRDDFVRDTAPQGERKKLLMKPKSTVPKSEVSPISPSTKPNPFGNAKPIDQQEIFRQKQKAEDDKEQIRKQESTIKPAEKQQPRGEDNRPSTKEVKPRIISKADTNEWVRGVALEPKKETETLMGKKRFGSTTDNLGSRKESREEQSQKTLLEKSKVKANAFDLLNEER